jgi:hypothetical protein
MIDRMVMDDYDAGFMDAVKLLEKKLDTLIEDQAIACQEDKTQQKNLFFLEFIKQKLFKE